MKLTYTPSKQLSFDIEGSNVKEFWAALSTLSETFGEEKCGQCGKADLRYVVRNVEGNNFYELACKGCGHKLSFGQSKDQKTVYPRRKYHKQHPDVKAKKAKEGDWLPFKGWEKFSFTESDD
jgi:hypothetical protein